MKSIKIIIVLLVISIYTIAQSTEQKPIQIADVETQREIRDTYNMIVSANKDLQIAILRAKIKYKVPETWEIDLANLTFNPPKPKESVKESKP